MRYSLLMILFIMLFSFHSFCGENDSPDFLEQAHQSKIKLGEETVEKICDATYAYLGQIDTKKIIQAPYKPLSDDSQDSEDPLLLELLAHVKQTAILKTYENHESSNAEQLDKELRTILATLIQIEERERFFEQSQELAADIKEEDVIHLASFRGWKRKIRSKEIESIDDILLNLRSDTDLKEDFLQEILGNCENEADLREDYIKKAYADDEPILKQTLILYLKTYESFYKTHKVDHIMFYFVRSQLTMILDKHHRKEERELLDFINDVSQAANKREYKAGI